MPVKIKPLMAVPISVIVEAGTLTLQGRVVHFINICILTNLVFY